MRKPYAVPEQYTEWDTETLKRYASNLAHMIMVMCSKHVVETPFDRHALGNAYEELHVIKTLLDARTRTYTTKLLLESLCGILETELAAYDQRGRNGRLERRKLRSSEKYMRRAGNLA